MKNDDIFYRWVFLLVILIVLGLCFAMIFLPIPKDNQQYANTILGFLLASAIGTLINWRWGSSKGSADKNEIMKGMENKFPPTYEPPAKTGVLGR
jgi:hypothetical protein